MEDLYHVSFTTDANFSSSNDILWCTEELNELRKVQFSRAEDHGDYGGIDPLYSNFGFFPDDPSTNHQKYHQQLQPSYHDYGKFDDNLQFDMGFKRLRNDDVAMATTNEESESLPFLETHPFGIYFSGLSDEEKEDAKLAEFLLASAEKVGQQHFEQALRLRMDRATGRVSCKDLQKGPSFDPLEAAKVLNPTVVAFYEELPFCQISVFTEVQDIIEDVAEAKKIHVIDLEIKKGGQWTILMQALESRHECPIELLKITAVESGTTGHIAEDTGKRLKDYAQGLNLPFSFNIVMVSDMLHLGDVFEIDAEEIIAVYSHFALRTKILESDQLEIMMRVIRTLSPIV
ncbi:Scarecrow-like protein 4 [Glycine soja]|uniref:Scarecrow-like protein 4 n=1 Tax=Glycine soja TaxID=3848 RepID=A0A0B2Q3X2_GLYSO|nr:Scarecrow-like protein 4 [Glycine soja]